MVNRTNTDSLAAREPVGEVYRPTSGQLGSNFAPHLAVHLLAGANFELRGDQDDDEGAGWDETATASGPPPAASAALKQAPAAHDASMRMATMTTPRCAFSHAADTGSAPAAACCLVTLRADVMQLQAAQPAYVK